MLWGGFETIIGLTGASSTPGQTNYRETLPFYGAAVASGLPFSTM